MTKKELREKNRKDHQEAFASWQDDYDAALNKAIDTNDPADIREARRLADLHPDTARTVSANLLAEQNTTNQARYTPILKSILGLAGVAASIQQINMANSAKRGLVRPGIPAPPQIDPALNQQIFNAQLGTMDAGRTAVAARVGINDAYNQAVQSATDTANGQAGIRQSLINKANLDKMRANVGMLPAIDAVRAREEGRADQLVGQRAQLGQQSYRDLLQATGMGLAQYNTDASAIGRLGAIGHENLFGQLQSMPENIVAGMGSYSNPYKPQYSHPAYAPKTPYSVPDEIPLDSDSARVSQYSDYLGQSLYGHSLSS